MTYYFNLYDSNHYGVQLNQISEDVYQNFLEGEDEDTADLNPLTLRLDLHKQYWIDIPTHYNYWDETPVSILTQKPFESDGNLFHLKYDFQSHHWEVTPLE